MENIRIHGFQLKAIRQSIVFLLEGLCGNSIGALRPAQWVGKYYNLRSRYAVGGEDSTRASTNRQLSTSQRFPDRKSEQCRGGKGAKTKQREPSAVSDLIRSQAKKRRIDEAPDLAHKP